MDYLNKLLRKGSGNHNRKSDVKEISPISSHQNGNRDPEVDGDFHSSLHSTPKKQQECDTESDTTADYESAGESSPWKEKSTNLSSLAETLAGVHLSTPKEPLVKLNHFPYSPISAEDEDEEVMSITSNNSQNSVVGSLSLMNDEMLKKGLADNGINTPPHLFNSTQIIGTPENEESSQINDITSTSDIFKVIPEPQEDVHLLSTGVKDSLNVSSISDSKVISPFVEFEDAGPACSFHSEIMNSIGAVNTSILSNNSLIEECRHEACDVLKSNQTELTKILKNEELLSSKLEESKRKLNSSHEAPVDLQRISSTNTTPNKNKNVILKHILLNEPINLIPLEKISPTKSIESKPKDVLKIADVECITKSAIPNSTYLQNITDNTLISTIEENSENIKSTVSPLKLITLYKKTTKGIADNIKVTNEDISSINSEETLYISLDNKVTDDALKNISEESTSMAVIPNSINQTVSIVSDSVLRLANEKYPVCIEESPENIIALVSPLQNAILTSTDPVVSHEISHVIHEKESSNKGNLSISEMCNLIETTFNIVLEENEDTVLAEVNQVVVPNLSHVSDNKNMENMPNEVNPDENTDKFNELELSLTKECLESNILIDQPKPVENATTGLPSLESAHSNLVLNSSCSTTNNQTNSHMLITNIKESIPSIEVDSKVNEIKSEENKISSEVLPQSIIVSITPKLSDLCNSTIVNEIQKINERSTLFGFNDSSEVPKTPNNSVSSPSQCMEEIKSNIVSTSAQENNAESSETETSLITISPNKEENSQNNYISSDITNAETNEFSPSKGGAVSFVLSFDDCDSLNKSPNTNKKPNISPRNTPRSLGQKKRILEYPPTAKTTLPTNVGQQQNEVQSMSASNIVPPSEQSKVIADNSKDVSVTQQQNEMQCMTLSNIVPPSEQPEVIAEYKDVRVAQQQNEMQCKTLSNTVAPSEQPKVVAENEDVNVAQQQNEMQCKTLSNTVAPSEQPTVIAEYKDVRVAQQQNEMQCKTLSNTVAPSEQPTVMADNSKDVSVTQQQNEMLCMTLSNIVPPSEQPEVIAEYKDVRVAQQQNEMQCKTLSNTVAPSEQPKVIAEYKDVRVAQQQNEMQCKTLSNTVAPSEQPEVIAENKDVRVAQQQNEMQCKTLSNTVAPSEQPKVVAENKDVNVAQQQNEMQCKTLSNTVAPSEQPKVMADNSKDVSVTQQQNEMLCMTLSNIVPPSEQPEVITEYKDVRVAQQQNEMQCKTLSNTVAPSEQPKVVAENEDVNVAQQQNEMQCKTLSNTVAPSEQPKVMADNSKDVSVTQQQNEMLCMTLSNIVPPSEQPEVIAENKDVRVAQQQNEMQCKTLSNTVAPSEQPKVVAENKDVNVAQQQNEMQCKTLSNIFATSEQPKVMADNSKDVSVTQQQNEMQCKTLSNTVAPSEQPKVIAENKDVNVARQQNEMLCMTLSNIVPPSEQPEVIAENKDVNVAQQQNEMQCKTLSNTVAPSEQPKAIAYNNRGSSVAQQNEMQCMILSNNVAQSEQPKVNFDMNMDVPNIKPEQKQENIQLDYKMQNILESTTKAIIVNSINQNLPNLSDSVLKLSEKKGLTSTQDSPENIKVVNNNPSENSIGKETVRNNQAIGESVHILPNTLSTSAESGSGYDVVCRPSDITQDIHLKEENSQISAPALPTNSDSGELKANLEEIVSKPKTAMGLFQSSMAQSVQELKTCETVMPTSMSRSTIEVGSYEDLLDKCSEQERMLGFDDSIKEEAEKLAKELHDASLTNSYCSPKVPSDLPIAKTEGTTTVTSKENNGDSFTEALNFDFEYLSKLHGNVKKTRESLFLKFDPLASVFSPDPVQPPKIMELIHPDSTTPPRLQVNDLEGLLVSITPSSANSRPEDPISSPSNYNKTPRSRPRSVGQTPPTLRHEIVSKEISRLQQIMLKQEFSYQEQMTAYNEEIDELRRKISDYENAQPIEELQDNLSIARAEVESLRDHVKKQKDCNDELLFVISEFESTLEKMVKKHEEEKQEFLKEKEELISEKTALNLHLSNMETTFNDIHKKYERSKQAIDLFMHNEREYKTCLSTNEQTIKQQNEKYLRLKEYASEKLEQANIEILEMKKAHQVEIAKLQAMNKKSEIQISTLEKSIEQKNREIAELTKICDDLIKVSGS